MEYLTDTQCESLQGGRFFAINVAPTIVVNTAITNALQGNVGNSIALGLLGSSATSGLAQFNQLGLFTVAA
ncbi:MAG: hypothetical protein WD136_05995 [Cyanobium sp.]